MERYKDLGGNSGVAGYQVGESEITVYFKDGGAYLYNYSSTGRVNVDEMKQLATTGHGLNSYVNRAVRKLYAAKLR